MQFKLDFGTSGGMSLFIPYVHLNTKESHIRYIFEQREKLGVIRLVKFIKRTNNDTGKEYNMVYIYFKYWYDTRATCDFQTRIQEERVLKVMYNDTRYWNVVPSNFWFKSSYADKDTIDCLELNLADLKDEYEICRNLVEKYRRFNYNETYESVFNRDLRELFGCDENSISS